MSAFDDLVRLEREEQDEAERLGTLRSSLTHSQDELYEAEQASLLRRKRILELHRQAEAERAAQEADSMYGEREALAKHYHRIASDYAWYDGVLDHQMTGAMFGAVAQRWILGDDPGLGKTRTAIGWLDLSGSRKVILIGEANVCEQLYGEVLENAPHRHAVLLAKRTPAQRHQLIDSILSKDEAIVIVNYEFWRRDPDALGKLITWQPDTVIVDEGHNIKSTATSNYKLVEYLTNADNVCPNCGGLIAGLTQGSGRKKSVKPCPDCGWSKDDPLEYELNDPLDDWLKSKSVQHLMFLTGTPILNSPDDLYSMLHLIDPTLFKLRTTFVNTYCRFDYHSGKYTFLRGGVAMLKQMIGHRYLARTRHDAGIKLPPQRVHIIPIELDREQYPLQYRTIQQISKQARIMLDSGEEMTIMHLITLLTRKRQANVWPGGIELKNKEGEVVFSVGKEVRESVKIDTILDYIGVFHEDGHRQIVFSQFKGALAEMERRLKEQGYRVARFDGDTPAKMRTAIKDNFYAGRDEPAQWDILLANYKSGGSGLNLTAATKVHILDEEWNPGKRDQAYDRVYRMGQEAETEVFVYRIRGTIDTWMANTISRKERMIRHFHDGMSSESATLSKEDLIEAMRNGEL